MKMLVVLILVLSYSSHLTLSTTNLKTSKSNSENKQDAFALAGSGDRIIPTLAGFKNPRLVKSVTGNPQVTPQSINTSGIYYDGSENLNVKVVNCNTWSLSPSDCVNNKNCGWCGDSRTCIPGNASGPLASCARASYHFTAPQGAWNPMNAGTININTEGRTILTHTPDVSGMKVRNYYN